MKQKYLLLSVFMIFFLAHSGGWQLQKLLWPIKIGMLLIFVLYVIHNVQKTKFRLGNRPPFYTIPIVVLFASFSVITLMFGGTSIAASRIDINLVYSYTLLFGFLLVVYFGSQFSRYLSNRNNQDAFIFALTHGAAIVAYSNFILFVLGINLGRAGFNRFSGWLDNPNTLGVILFGAFPIVLQESLRQAPGRVTYERLLLITMLFLVIMTGSRSAVFGMSVMGGIIIWRYSMFGRFVSVVLVVTGLWGVIADINPLELLSTITQFQRTSRDILSGRSEVWEMGRYVFSHEPWLGYGMGTEKSIIDVYLPVWSIHKGFNFHNSYLSLLVTHGVIGASLMFLLIGIGLFNAIQIIIKPQRVVDHFTFLMAVMFIGFLCHAFFETWLFSPGSLYGFVFWTACFILLSANTRISRYKRQVISFDNKLGLSAEEKKTKFNNDVNK